jgi:hypothetical protein
MKYLNYLVLLFSLVSCNFDKAPIREAIEFAKAGESDPFKGSMVESQYFEVDPKQDNVVEGKDGTVIFIPQGAFIDKYGNTVMKKVSFELAQPSSLSEMLLSNYTTTANGVPHQSEAMLYVSANIDGQPVFINPDNPLYAEVASDAGRDGMQLYRGDRTFDGKMNWTDSEPLERWLSTVDLELLSFYPPGFEKQVESGMPFRHYREATKSLKDSLYYSMTNQNEDLHSEETDRGSSQYYHGQDTHCSIINPASIKVLKQQKFQNTLIATKAFEKRLQVIFGTCNQKILDLYIHNIDKNLWEIDSMVASMLGPSHIRYKDFMNFYEEKLTKVQNSPVSQSLSVYYSKQLKKVEKDLYKARKEYEALLQKKEREAEKKRKEYQDLLGKRQVYRMEKFGFNVKKMGYYNVVKIIQKLETVELSVHIENGAAYDRCYVYIINPLIKSLFAMTSIDNTLFEEGYERDKYLLMWKEQEAVAIAIAYKDEQPYYAAQNFSIQKVNNLRLNPLEISMKKLKDTLSLYRSYSKENKIILDLEYQHDFYKEKKRQEQLLKDHKFIDNLYLTVYSPCCSYVVLEGKMLFENNCVTCHCKDSEKIGPSLKNISTRRSNEWIVRFVQNSSRVIREGDPYAVELYNRYNKTEMPAFDIDEYEILKIIAYLNAEGKERCNKKEVN